MGQPRPQGLGARLLGGKSFRIRCGPRRTPIRFAALDLGETALDEALVVLLQNRFDAADIAKINPETHNHRTTAPARPAVIAACIL